MLARKFLGTQSMPAGVVLEREKGKRYDSLAFNTQRRRDSLEFRP